MRGISFAIVSVSGSPVVGRDDEEEQDDWERREDQKERREDGSVKPPLWKVSFCILRKSLSLR